MSKEYSTWHCRHKILAVIAAALKDYDKTHSNPIPAFEKEFGCKLRLNELGQIEGVTFENESAESMFYLKYGNKR